MNNPGNNSKPPAMSHTSHLPFNQQNGNINVNNTISAPQHQPQPQPQPISGSQGVISGTGTATGSRPPRSVRRRGSNGGGTPSPMPHYPPHHSQPQSQSSSSSLLSSSSSPSPSSSSSPASEFSNYNNNNLNGGGHNNNMIFHPHSQYTVATSTKASGETKVIDLRPYLKNVNCKVIILEKHTPNRTKDDHLVTRALVADETAACFMSLWDKDGELLQPGDIIRVHQGHVTLFKSTLVLAAGRYGKIERVGEFTMVFNESNNISSVEWVEVADGSSNQKRAIPKHQLQQQQQQQQAHHMRHPQMSPGQQQHQHQHQQQQRTGPMTGRL